MTPLPRRWVVRAGAASLAAGVAALPLGMAPGIAGGPAPAWAADTSCADRRTAPVYVPAPSTVLTDLGRDAVWRIATGRGVTVAVVDSGINVGNAHLPQGSAVLPGQTLLPAIEGYAPEPHGWSDLSGHGTTVASIIAGRPVPGSGQVGLAKDAQLLPVQVYGVTEEQGRSDPRLTAVVPQTDRLAAGIRAAAERGAKVINVSLSLDRPDQGLADAVTFANDRGALVVASAGDRATATNKADGPRYPAAFPNVVSVTALTSRYTVDAANNIQGEHITVAAPGQGLTVALGAVGDCVLDGPAATSYATPLVSATAALLAERFPAETPAMWKYRIEASALRPLADRKDTALGWGVLSPYDALTMTLDPNRAGPALPGYPAPTAPAALAAPVSVEVDPDPLARHRAVGIWVAFLAVASVAALRLVRVLRTGPAPDALE